MPKIDHQTTTDLIKKTTQLIIDINAESKNEQLKTLQAASLVPNFWKQANAKQTVQEIALLEEELASLNQLKKLQQDVAAYLELKEGLAEDELKLMTDEFEINLRKLQKLIEKQEFKQYLSGKYDKSGAILSIHSGQGGTEAMDWAEMLSRMYLRFFEKKGWKYKFVSESRGEEAGIKEVVYEIKATYAYGYLKKEQGTHRLVRLSPFNADNLRQTSFALVEVLPIIDNESAVDIKTEDLSWNFTRAGGAGGQSVNKVNSAVELTHLPTGIVVRCRQERKQSQNKEHALKILKAKLAAQQEAQQEAQIAAAKGKHSNASWGTQIRNYILHPYKLVKDTRTGVESSDPDAVLDGELDKFIEEEIKL